MVKRLLIIVIPVVALWLQWQNSVSSPHPVALIKAEAVQPLTAVNGPLPAHVPEAVTPHWVVVTKLATEQPLTGVTGPWHPLAPAPNAITRRIFVKATQPWNPAEMAVLLKELFEENPNGLSDALIAIGKERLETRQRVLPLLAEALTLWPEAEGRDVFPIAEAYAEIDLPAAAEWGAIFLITTNRSDLAVSSLPGRLAEVSEDQALFLIASLPQEARKDAMNSVAYHIQIGDLNHLMQVCNNLDPQSISTFSKQLFERLGMERLDETAAWLVATSGAAKIPGAISSISQALVSKDGPQKAMAWADSLSDANAEAQAITAIYREWAKLSLGNAIQDVLSAYEGTPQLMADVFKGAAEHHGSGAAMQWDAACSLVNSSARAYAISALIEPMLVTIGPAETKAKIAALPTPSLERDVAELMIQGVYKSPVTVRQIENRFGKIE